MEHINENKELNGKGKQKCCMPSCGFKSLRGHVKGKGLCPFHWCYHVWGIEHALKQYPNHPEAKNWKGL